MSLAAGLDVGGSAVKAWVRDVDSGQTWRTTARTTTVRPAPDRAELVPAHWEQTCRRALADVVQQTGRSVNDFLGVTVSSLRQGFVLLDAHGAPLGNGVLNSDRRGRGHMQVLAGTHELTGHWPAPELTLPKLLALQAEEPDRWQAARRVLFVHDWLLWLLSGQQVTEVSYACAGGMADVPARGWAGSLLEDCGLGTGRLAPLVEPGTVVGELQAGWALPPTLPVVAGCGDTQLAALGVGGLQDGVVTVVAGSSTPVLASTSTPVRDPLSRPWVSTHAAVDRWAAEGNAGYPGTYSGWWAGLVPETGGGRQVVPPGPGAPLAVTAAPYWSQETWSSSPPASLVGLRPDTTAADVRAALLRAHAYAVSGNVEDLERALDRRSTAVVLTGGTAAQGELPGLLAAVLGRDVHVAGASGAAAGGAYLVARAVGAHAHVPGLPDEVVPAGDPEPWRPDHLRWRAACDGLRALSGS